MALRVFCDSLIRTTCAPGITAPDGSTTRPVTLPVVTCASAAGTASKKTSIVGDTLRIFKTPFFLPFGDASRSDYPVYPRTQPAQAANAKHALDRQLREST